MGRCHEFGVTVREDCGHPMQAGDSACHCTVCDVVCEGQFAGCATVWANGPRSLNVVRPEERATPLGLADSRLVTEVDVVARAQEDVAEELTARAEETLTQPEKPVAISELRTAWPLVEGWKPKDVAQAVPGQVSDVVAEAKAPEPEAAAPAVLAEEQARIFEWLESSFDGLRAQMRVLSDAVDRQHGALAALTDSSDAAERFLDVADALPGRIGEAVREAMVSHSQREERTSEPANGAPGRGAGDKSRPPGRALRPLGPKEIEKALSILRTFRAWARAARSTPPSGQGRLERQRTAGSPGRARRR